MTAQPTSVIGRLRRLFRPRQDASNRFLSDVRGVIHVGAHEGQERSLYARHKLDVIWVEAQPSVYARLIANLRHFPRQTAINALLTDRDGDRLQFNVSSNAGASSSILTFAKHEDVWPEVTMNASLILPTRTLASLVVAESIDPTRFDGLIMDTQGSELRVLQGAEPLLNGFRYIKTEAADFEAYSGCCQVEDIERYLKSFGFRELLRSPFAQHPDGGQYFDLVYSRPASAND
jgi:FkbM family methyltransferase